MYELTREIVRQIGGVILGKALYTGAIDLKQAIEVCA